MDVWDALAPSYDDWYATPVGAFAHGAEVAALVALAGELGGVRGIEIGCGTGQFTRAFAQRGARMVGVDRSAAMLAVAARHPTGAPLLCRAHGEQLPYPAGTFDVALIVTVLEFVPDPQSVLAEMWRVLRPRGRLVVGALNAWSLWAVARRLRPGKTPYAHAHFFQPPELVRLLARLGPVKWRGAVFLPPWVQTQAKAWWPLIEDTGARWLPMFGAFLAAGVQKPTGE